MESQITIQLVFHAVIQTLSKYYTSNMSFKQKPRDRSVENTSGVDNRTSENEGEITFELLHKYFDKKFDEQN